jgi:hypothetical protein
MAAQYYGAGLSAVICVQNLWRWRLARDGDPQTFDRFWRQLFRHLGQASRQEFQIQLLDQDLTPHADIRALVARQPRPEAVPSTTAAADYTVRVRAPDGGAALEQKTRLVPERPIEVRFRAEREGLYTILVEDGRGVALATQPVEVRDVDREMERTGRDLENLRQWASLSGGLALPEEEIDGVAHLAARIQARIEDGRRRARVPVGVDGTVLAGVLAALCGEWALRRRWGLA